MHEKPRMAVVSEIVDPRLAPMIIPRSRSLRMGKTSDLTFNQTVTECLDACLPVLYSKSLPRDSLSVGAIHFREQSDVPNKLSGECMLPQELCKIGRIIQNDSQL